MVVPARIGFVVFWRCNGRSGMMMFSHRMFWQETGVVRSETNHLQDVAVFGVPRRI